MRKLLWLIVCLTTMVMFSSCGANYLITANYEVCYPDGTKAQDKSAEFFSTGTPSVVCHSYAGTNYISVTTNDNPLMGKAANRLNHIASTTAPMRLNSYNVEKTKKKKRYHSR